MGQANRLRAILLGGAAFYGLAVAAETLAPPAVTNRAQAQDLQLQNLSADETPEGATAKPSGPAAGQSTALQRIVVGAGAEKIAIDTPQAVTVIDQDDLDQEQATTVGDVFDRVPGVSVSGSERVLGETFNIRGIGAPESAGDEGRIIVNVDGANKFYESYRMGSFFSDPELYKRIEVLRGPASSTLYGAGALGGVINFTTKDASDFLEEGETVALRLKGAYDSNPNGKLASAILAFTMNNNAEFLLAGNYRNYQGYTTGDGTEIDTAFLAPSGLIKGTFRFGDNDEQTVRASYQLWKSEGDDQPYAQVTTTPTFGTIDRSMTDQTAVLAYENPDSDNDWINYRVSVSYSNITNEQTDSRDLTGRPNPPASIFQDTNYGYETWQINAQNTFDTAGDAYENHFTFGVQTAHQTRSTEVASAFGFHPAGTDFQAGIFAQNELILFDRLTLIPGMRIDYQGLTPDSTVMGGSDATDTAFSPKLAAHFKFNETFAVFGSFAHTERFPSLDEIYSNDYAAPALPNYSLNLKKERSDNLEAGFSISRYDTFADGDSFQLKTTGFYNDIKDYIERTRNAYPQYVNTGKALIYGGEVELAYQSEYIFANAGYSIVRGENRAPISPTNPLGNLNTVAPDELSLTIGARLPDYGLAFGVKSRIVAAQNRVAGTATSRLATKSFHVHDLFATWKPKGNKWFDGLETQFGVENLFDRQYREFLSNDPAKGRTFKVSLVKKFGL